MLNQFINIINECTPSRDGDVLFISSCIIKDPAFINALNDYKCINIIHKNDNIVSYDELQIGDCVDIEFSLLHLKSIGFYDDIATFIQKNKYIQPSASYYIRDINYLSGTDDNDFIKVYTSVVELINAIKSISKFNHTEVDIDYALIDREDKSILLPFIYDDRTINNIINVDAVIDALNATSLLFRGTDTKEKFIGINELIEFLVTQPEDDRFAYVIKNITLFCDRYNASYQYYIRDFTYNRLKSELDTAALDYIKRVQAIINDAQTKLIAIPVAFVLAASSIDFTSIYAGKNFIILTSLWIFAWLIHLFLKNQTSSLTFVKEDIKEYKESYKRINDIVQTSFKSVDTELQNQKNRLKIIRYINWGIPVFITLFILLYIFHQTSIIF
jgi:hypothetical protein